MRPPREPETAPKPQPRPSTRPSYFNEDTIAAIASAVGGAVAVIRVSGPRAYEALATLTAGAAPGTARDPAKEPRRLTRVDLYSRGGKIDSAMAVFFPKPRTFTGEDVVEFHVHGGAFIATRVLEALIAAGHRQALPGEFSFRAVRNGKMTLSQAQAVADLVAASNAGAAGLALEKLSGARNEQVARAAESLRRLVTLGEVGIDFSDQDVAEVALPALKTRALEAANLLRQLLAGYRRGAALQHGIRVAFVGEPNAGKSSLFNALLGEDRSIVSDVPGTTRDVVRESLTLSGMIGDVSAQLSFRVHDTAGLRGDDRADSEQGRVERLGMERTRAALADAELVLLTVDATTLWPGQAPVKSPEEALAHFLESAGGARGVAVSSRVLGVLTKCDLRQAHAPGWIPTSSQTGQGIEDLVHAMLSEGAKIAYRAPGEVLLTRADHAEAVAAALAHLERALTAPENDLFAADCWQALRALEPVVGETVSDDILARVFSEFCIGK